jgi:hypothetical protein
LKPVDAPLSNQYLVHPTLELRQTDYPSTQPERLAKKWREQGWSAVRHGTLVRVFHGADAPLPVDRAEASEQLPITNSEATVKALNGTLSRALVKAGYRCRGDRKFTLLQSQDGRLHPSGLKGVQVHYFRTWTWDFEFQGDTCWLTPKPTWTKVTDMPAARFAAVFKDRHPERRWTIVDIQNGQFWTKQALADYSDAEWGQSIFTRVIYAPRTEAQNVPPDIQALHNAVQAESAFAGMADVRQPRHLDAQSWQPIGGAHLRIRKTAIAERKQVNKLSVHRRPLQPVTLKFVLPRPPEATSRALTYRFGTPTQIKAAGFDLPVTTVPYLWNVRWTLRSKTKNGPAAELTWSASPLHYDPETGNLDAPHKLQEATEQAREEGRTLVTLTVLPEKGLSREALATLLSTVRPFNHVLFTQDAYAAAGQVEKSDVTRAKVARLALKILRAGGGLPYELSPLPGTGVGTYYLGLDVGSAHRGGWSNVAMVLVNRYGHVVAKRVERFEQNNERIPADLLTQILPAWLKELSEIQTYDRVHRRGAIRLRHLIVHRDGRFLDTEAAELQDALADLEQLDLIEVKKNSGLHVQAELQEPATCQLSARTAVIFNHSALNRQTKPIEVHAISETDILQAAAQVYWLSEMRTDELYQPGRLPLTTFLADRLATTT